jgi:hypothetical protein
MRKSRRERTVVSGVLSTAGREGRCGWSRLPSRVDGSGCVIAQVLPEACAKPKEEREAVIYRSLLCFSRHPRKALYDQNPGCLSLYNLLSRPLREEKASMARAASTLPSRARGTTVLLQASRGCHPRPAMCCAAS